MAPRRSQHGCSVRLERCARRRDVPDERAPIRRLGRPRPVPAFRELSDDRSRTNPSESPRVKGREDQCSETVADRAVISLRTSAEVHRAASLPQSRP